MNWAMTTATTATATAMATAMALRKGSRAELVLPPWRRCRHAIRCLEVGCFLKVFGERCFCAQRRARLRMLLSGHNHFKSNGFNMYRTSHHIENGCVFSSRFFLPGLAPPHCGPLPKRACDFAPWGEWGECSATCDGGMRERSRHIKTPNSNDGVRGPGKNWWPEFKSFLHFYFDV